MGKNSNEVASPRSIEESALRLDDLSVGMPITVTFVDREATENYTVADLPRRHTVGELGSAADVLLEDIQGNEYKFAAADLGLLPYLGGFWSKNTTTRR